MMIGYVIRKEILANLSSPTFLIIFILCFGLIFLSLYTGLKSYDDQITEYRLAETLHQKILEEKTTYADVSSGIQVGKPPKVLSIFVSGIENILGRYATIDTHNKPVLSASKIEGNPIFALFGDLDLIFMIKTVFSLLAILFTYNTISGEKEDGTLRLIFSYPIPRDTLILGKMVGVFLCLIIPLIIPIVLGIALLTLFPNVHLEGKDWVQLLLILSIFMLYMISFFSLGMLVSARTSQSSISFLILLFIWVIWTLVIPRGSVVLASQFAHLPSIHEHRVKLEQVEKDIYQKYPASKFARDNPPPRRPKVSPNIPKGEQNQIMATYKRASSEWNEKWLAWLEERSARINAEWKAEEAKLEQDYSNKQQYLAKLAIGLSKLSPSSTMTYAAMNLAGTGIEGQGHFLTSVRAYQEKFAAYFAPKIQEEQRMRWTNPAALKNKPIDISDMPRFQYQQESLSDILGRVVVDMSLMVLLVLLFLSGAYVSFLKYDVR